MRFMEWLLFSVLGIVVAVLLIVVFLAVEAYYFSDIETFEGVVALMRYEVGHTTVSAMPISIGKTVVLVPRTSYHPKKYIALVKTEEYEIEAQIADRILFSKLNRGDHVSGYILIGKVTHIQHGAYILEDVH